MGFLLHITGKREIHQADRSWEQLADEEVQRVVGIQLSATLHRPLEGNGSIVGDLATTPRFLYVVNRLLGERKDENAVVDTGDNSGGDE